MSFREALITACEVPFVPGPGMEQLPDIAYAEHPGVVGQWLTYGEVVDAAYPLSMPYRHLAWLAVGAVYDAVEQQAGGGIVTGRMRHLAEASTAGIFGMVRYLTLLPIVYEAHRGNFDDVPPTIAEQVRELGGIARRNTEYLPVIADQSIQVSGRAEKDDGLRGKLSGNLHVLSKDMAHTFVLDQKPAGLTVQARFDVNERLQRIKDYYHADQPEGRNLDRAPGCMALRMESDGTNLFDVMWNKFVDVAVTDARFFEADLDALAAMRHEWEEPELAS